MDEHKTVERKATKIDLLKDNLPTVDIRTLFGPNDYNLKALDKHYGTESHYLDGAITITGASKETCKLAKKALLDILFHIAEHGDICEDNLRAFICAAQAKEHKFQALTQVQIKDGVLKIANSEQQALWDAMFNNDIIIVNGPAGTGKTMLAIGYAILGLTEERFHKIIFSRPAVETSKSIGALPGDEMAKIEPFLRPIYDNLSYFCPNPQWMTKNIEDGHAELNHVGYMRGRSLRDTCMVFDEAQNFTVSEAKMAVTRIAKGSKTIIVGDITQCDLGTTYEDEETGYRSGLAYLYDKLVHQQDNIPGVAVIDLTEKSVMRHETVKHILPYLY